MNKEWVDYRLAFLSEKIGFCRTRKADYNFEPSEVFYSQLESGEESDLESAVSLIGKHIGIDRIPNVMFEWGIKMELEVAGQINVDTGEIKVPFYYAGKKYPLGTILSHEVTHSFLKSKGVWLSDELQNEMLTDAAAVFLGLGKLYLNGVLSDANDCSPESLKLCYLSPELIGYCYKQINEVRGIAAESYLSNLLPQAKRLIA
jgi:hypothetical protein